MNNNIKEIIKKGKHLPKFMRDFHDQKELFNTIELIMGQIEDINWVKGQIYTIDRFLKFMAIHGYTLKKTINSELEITNTIIGLRAIKDDILINQILNDKKTDKDNTKNEDAKHEEWLKKYHLEFNF